MASGWSQEAPLAPIEPRSRALQSPPRMWRSWTDWSASAASSAAELIELVTTAELGLCVYWKGNINRFARSSTPAAPRLPPGRRRRVSPLSQSHTLHSHMSPHTSISRCGIDCHAGPQHQPTSPRAHPPHCCHTHAARGTRHNCAHTSPPGSSPPQPIARTSLGYEQLFKFLRVDGLRDLVDQTLALKVDFDLL